MASRFWVGGTGTWDASTTTHWSATTGGAGGASVPTSADDVNFDGSSGGGTVTVNNASLVVQSLTIDTFTGTLDFSVNNNNITLGNSGLTGSAFSCNATSTKTLKMGNGTWNLTSAANNIWNSAGSSGLTLVCGGSTLQFAPAAQRSTAAMVFNSSGGINAATFNNIVIKRDGHCGSMNFFGASFSQLTCANFTADTKQVLYTQGGGLVVTGSLNINGTAYNDVCTFLGSLSGSQTITLPNSTAISWAALGALQLTGTSLTASNSFDLGGNSGITITGPSGGSSSGFVIGS